MLFGSNLHFHRTLLRCRSRWPSANLLDVLRGIHMHGDGNMSWGLHGHVVGLV
jgi:hypothetical protein